MNTIVINKKDEIVMKLVHYFVTEQNYVPIVVNGTKDEIWLENSDGPYRIVRINSNYIHNNEQYSFDVFKTNSIIQQIKKKTLSFSVNALNILINVNDNVDLTPAKNIDAIKLDKISDIKKNKLLNTSFPELNNKLIDSTDGLELVMNITSDINKKTEEDNRIYSKIFAKKPTNITKILVAINVIMFILSLVLERFDINMTTMFANNRILVQMGDYYRLLTSMFLHTNVIHLLTNCYALYIIGSQVEQYLGKAKYLAIYFISGLTGSLLSALLNNAFSIGASGAIFGLLGSLLYFGYYFRIYLGSVLKTQLIPLLVFNLAIGFIIPGIDIFAHIGGLVGGLFATMALGISHKSEKSDKTNGIILLIVLYAFLIYMLFFK